MSPDARWPWQQMLIWQAYLLGAAATLWLLHRRHRLAGLVGFLTAAPFTYFAVGPCLALWGRVIRGGRLHEVLFGAQVNTLGSLLYVTAVAFLPTAVLIRHFLARHRLLLYEPETDIDHEVTVPRQRGGYYFVTVR